MEEMERARVELKYCECCGGLLLRPVGTAAVYCGTCRQRMEKLAPPRPAKHPGPKPKVEEQAVSPAVEDGVGDLEAAAIPAADTGEADETRRWA